jgi:hypothetical protein
VPVGGNEAGYGVENFRGFARIGHRLVGKVSDFDACCSKTLYAVFG